MNHRVRYFWKVISFKSYFMDTQTDTHTHRRFLYLDHWSGW